MLNKFSVYIFYAIAILLIVDFSLEDVQKVETKIPMAIAAWRAI